jgi:hypothetical protein
MPDNAGKVKVLLWAVTVSPIGDDSAMNTPVNPMIIFAFIQCLL